jgi:hypothetical protein
MKKAMETKLQNYKIKYNDLMRVVTTHEKKFEKLVHTINSVNFVII